MSQTTRTEMERMVGYHDLLADLRHPGCPMCHGAGRSVWRYLDGLLWESVNDPGIRAILRAAHGFCREHWLMALQIASAASAASGIAILAEDLLGHVLTDADQAVSAGGSSRRRKTPMLVAEAPCPACVTAQRTADAYLDILAVAEAGTQPYASSRHAARGICLPHLARGFGLVRDPVGRARLLEIFRRGTEELRGQLREFGRKHDYRFRHEGFTSAEASSWRRAVHRLIGEPSPAKEPRREMEP